jgi:hypothetical protein
MRSVLTVIIFIILLGLVLLYKMTESGKILDGFRGSSGSNAGHSSDEGSGRAVGYGQEKSSYFPFFGYTAPELPAEEANNMENQPCSTDLHCATGHCSMFGFCTNGLSL